MKTELAELGLEYASKLGASYADVRFVDGDDRRIGIKNGKPDNVSHTAQTGVGVRVIVNNGWGFAGSNVTDEKSLKETIEKAVKLAKASALMAKEPVKLVPIKTHVDTWKSDCKINPFDIPMEDLLELLTDADKAFRDNSPHVRTSSAAFNFKQEKKYIATSEGSRIKKNNYRNQRRRTGLCHGQWPRTAQNL